MKFSISKETLFKPLSKLNAIVSKKTTQPILSHLLIELDHSGAKLKGTDTEVSLQIDLSADQLTVEREGAITVPVSKLVDVIRHLPPSAMVNIELENEQLIIKSAGSLFRLATLPAADFPALTETNVDKRLEINSESLYNIMRKVQFSMAKDDPRYYLNGLFLNIVEDGTVMHAVTTDGHRLSCAHSELEQLAPVDTNLILPKKGVEEILKLISDLNQPVVLNLGERQLNLNIDNHNLTTQLIDGQYPKYQEVVPPLQAAPILIDRKRFLESLQRARVLLTDKQDGIRLRFAGNELFLSARNLANETVEEVIDVVNSAGTEIETGLNISYLIEAISTLNDSTVQLHFEDERSPLLMTSSEDSEVKYIIMPMRI